MDIDPGGLVFIFFHCTIAQNTHVMGSFISGATLEILGHPSLLGEVPGRREDQGWQVFQCCIIHARHRGWRTAR